MGRARALRIALLLAALLPANAWAQSPIAYRLSFPEVAQHLMQVEMTLPDLPPGPLELRMSRSSPGRYALHEFAKNVFDVRIADAAGQALVVTRPDAHGWDVPSHAGTVHVTYTVYGDRVDGTYLAIDTTHAHLNMPATLMWARGLEDRSVRVQFERPSGSQWQIATQLMRAGDPYTFTAPNLQYLMDSPTELSRFTLRSFTVPDTTRTPVFRVAVHHTGAESDVDDLARGVEAIVREARGVFREFPAFESNTYTFIADYTPGANDDGMEHRNSTILTSSGSIRESRLSLLDTVAHEFFHAWNVERIRPRSLEPFDFDRANMSGELWFAEGFTSYYGPLVMKRAGLTTLQQFAQDVGGAITAVVTSPGRRLRSAVEMSQFAPFVDAATSIDRTAFSNTFLSYYTWGSAIGLGLDLALRDRTDGRVSLDDVMRVAWERFGRPGGRVTGSVDRPYTIEDLKDILTDVSGNAAFTREFFGRYVEGRDVVDYAPLLARAGLVLRAVEAGRGFAGELATEGDPAGVRIMADVPFGSPAFLAGLARGDRVTAVGGTRVTRAADLERLVSERKPGDPLPVDFERDGVRRSVALRLVENPRLELVSVEDTGGQLSDAQRRFRDAWLGSSGRSTFQP
jgi:predicted metalloprotease with PDZ domain